MTRYHLDTGIASDFINRRRGVYERARDAAKQGHQLGIGTQVLGELWAGIHNSATRERNEKRLIRALTDLRVWPFDRAAAEEFGRLFAELRRTGRPTGQVDVQIAAITLTLKDCELVTKDSDFKAIPGLITVDWSTGT